MSGCTSIGEMSAMCFNEGIARTAHASQPTAYGFGKFVCVGCARNTQTRTLPKPSAGVFNDLSTSTRSTHESKEDVATYRHLLERISLHHACEVGNGPSEDTLRTLSAGKARATRRAAVQLANLSNLLHFWGPDAPA